MHSFQLSPWSREASKLNSEDLDTYSSYNNWCMSQNLMYRMICPYNTLNSLNGGVCVSHSTQREKLLRLNSCGPHVEDGTEARVLQTHTDALWDFKSATAGSLTATVYRGKLLCFNYLQTVNSWLHRSVPHTKRTQPALVLELSIYQC